MDSGPTPTLTIPIMGRSLIDHDERNRAWPVRALLPAQPRKSKTWRRGSAYDQGRTSSCVGYTFRGLLNTATLSAHWPWIQRTKFAGLDIYHGAQTYDEWPGEEPEYEGTSARGACRYLTARGLITEYRWCFGIDDVLDTLSHHGSVAIGVNWRQGMMDTNAWGFIYPHGQVVGGHEVELHGIDVRDGHVIGTNSWGTDWGEHGRFRLTWTDLDTLLQDQGDAVTLT